MQPASSLSVAAGKTAGPSNQNAYSGTSGSIAEQEQEQASSARLDRDERESFGDEDLHDDEEAGLTSNDRTRKQKKKRRLTRLDQRIAAEKSLSIEEQREADKSVVKKLVVNATLILLWYIFSLSISLVCTTCQPSGAWTWLVACN